MPAKTAQQQGKYTIKDLIRHLQQFNPDAILLVDAEGEDLHRISEPYPATPEQQERFARYEPLTPEEHAAGLILVAI